MKTTLSLSKDEVEKILVTWAQDHGHFDTAKETSLSIVDGAGDVYDIMLSSHKEHV